MKATTRKKFASLVAMIRRNLKKRQTTILPLNDLKEVKEWPGELHSTTIRRISDKSGADYIYNASEVRFFEYN